MIFNEAIFIKALINRPEDAKRSTRRFRPEWLQIVEYRPILNALYVFLRQHGMPPSIAALHALFSQQEPEAYNNRIKESLDKIEATEIDQSLELMTLAQAKDVAMVRSFQELNVDVNFLRAQEEFDSEQMSAQIHQWKQLFNDSADSPVCLTIDEAVGKLLTDIEFHDHVGQIPIGVNVIDSWCGGGLRAGQLGIIMAPTGHGKSVLLTQAARRVAHRDEHDVWFITNELTINEASERFLAALTNTLLSEVMHWPPEALRKWREGWQGKLKGHLRLGEYNREVSVNDLEADMLEITSMTGWKPKLICLDYMERMKPNETGYSRDKEWNWLQAIAQDLTRWAKRQNLLIWTACQTNRSGLTAAALGMEMAQSSIKHFQEAAAVIGLQKIGPANPEDTLQILKFTPLKMRQSKLGYKSVHLVADLARMKILNEEIEINKDDKDTTTSTQRGGV